MTGSIPKEFIQQLVNQTDIVDVVQQHIPLKKAGKNYSACCPFHNEKTASFTVSAEKQFYHCFGCGAHGNAIGFLMEYDKLTFVEAIETLAEALSIDVPTHNNAAKNTHTDFKPLYQLLEDVSNYYQHCLWKQPQSEAARHYLKGRHLSKEIIKRYALGFVPGAWDNVIKQIAKTPTELKALVTTGMVIEKTPQKHYDRFRNRVMFPIRNRKGQVLGFGGRVVEPEDTPKYLNSPETCLFHKGKTLYGVYELLQSKQHFDYTIVVEGYMDVIALAQHGIANSVATLGTAISKDHLEQLFRIAPKIIFCFDGDSAGQKAAWRALEVSLPTLKSQREVGFLILPSGDDPDTLVRKIGTQAMQQQLNDAIPLSHYLLTQLTHRFNIRQTEGKAKLIAEAKTLIQDIPDDILKQLLAVELADITHYDQDHVMGLLGITVHKSTNNFNRYKPFTPNEKLQVSSPARMALALLLQNNQLVLQSRTWLALQKVEHPGAELIWQCCELLQSNTNMTTGGLIEYFRDKPEAKYLSKLAVASLEIPTDGIQDEFEGSIQRLLESSQNNELELLLKKSRQTSLNSVEKSRLQALLIAAQNK